tara:strand:- start:273 stop:953 length:681 start_codon:yes stop_codon:yes gene_type:complete
MAYIGKEPTPVPLVTADLTDNLVTLAKLASGTDGNLITYDASGNPAAVATGNDGQVLTSSGVGAAPVFEAAPGGGKIGQVLTVQNLAVESTTSTSFATIADLSVAITPAATSSKILVVSSLQTAHSPNHLVYRLMRDSTAIGIGASSGSTTPASFSMFEGGAQEGYACWSHHFTWLDSPSSTSELAYTWQWRTDSGTTYINRSEDGTDHANYPRCPSSITVMEVLA